VEENGDELELGEENRGESLKWLGQDDDII
jgi:hypothetical protein